MINVYLVDDQTLVRQGIRSLLELDEDMHIIGEASDGAEAIEKLPTSGADVVLLIVGVLSDAELRALYKLTYDLGMQALVEVHNQDELARALAVDAHVIGVNNRDLRTFQVDIENTARLRAQIPAGKVVVGESGIRNGDDVQKMTNMGCDAILVGETFCKLPQAERAAAVKEFVRAGRVHDKVKG